MDDTQKEITAARSAAAKGQADATQRALIDLANQRAEVALFLDSQQRYLDALKGDLSELQKSLCVGMPNGETIVKLR